DELPRILGRVRNGERIQNYETLRRAKDGTVITVSLTISPVRSPSGTIVGASKIARDITERKRYEEALKRANADLAASEERFRTLTEADIHGLKEAQRALSRVNKDLRESEQRFRSLAEAVPSMLWTTAADGVDTYVSLRYQEYTGLDRDAFLQG